MASNPLKPCPKSPNCVSTSSGQDDRRIEPIPYTGSSDQAKSTLMLALKGMKGVEVVAERPDYVHATFTSPLFGFVDDVEFWLDDPAKLIHFRSSSRVGYYDFDANRKRMEDFRTRFLQTQGSK